MVRMNRGSAASNRVIAYRPRASRVIRVGSDFSGLGTADIAVGKMVPRIRYKIEFMCDKLAESRRLAKLRSRDTQLFDDISERDHDNVPETDLYTWTPPCQAFSKNGKQRGTADPRGMLLKHGIKYIAKKRPRVWIFENVKGLTGKKFKATYNGVKKCLKKTLKYNVFEKVLKTNNFDVAQTRERVYLVGIRDQVRPYMWPKESTTKPKLEDILEPFCAKTDKCGRFPKSPSLAKELMRLACRDAVAKGVDPLKVPIAIGIDCSMKFKIYGINECRTLTHTRGRSGGPWISTRGRRMTTTELLRLQGFDDGDIPWAQAGISSSQLGAMLGDAVSLNVIGPVIAEALYSAGVVNEKLVFTRGSASSSS